jgi:hypothetical protein
MIWPPKTVPSAFACCGKTYSVISVSEAEPGFVMRASSEDEEVMRE